MTAKNYIIIEPNDRIDFLELLYNVVQQTDKENWEYFSEDLTILSKDFLNYGRLSRVIALEDSLTKELIPVGYVQARILKQSGPQLLYKDFYHHAGLSGTDLWETNSSLKNGSPIYIDVIAVKKEFQNNRKILSLITFALQSIISEIKQSGSKQFDMYAVGVTPEGRKMCKIFQMEKQSSVVRTEDNIDHIRTLFKLNSLEFEQNLYKFQFQHKLT